MLKKFKVKEKWNVKVSKGWQEYVDGMAGEQWKIDIPKDSEGVASIYGNGDIAVKFDSIEEPPNGGKLVSYDRNKEDFEWLKEL